MAEIFLAEQRHEIFLVIHIVADNAEVAGAVAHVADGVHGICLTEINGDPFCGVKLVDE